MSDQSKKSPKAGRVAQVIEYLLSKHEALNLNPSIEKEKKATQKTYFP
jgi:hypothetical protein